MIEIIGGLIGFEQYKFFNLKPLNEKLYKLVNLESELYFILVDHNYIRDYNPLLLEEQKKVLQIKKKTHALIANIINFKNKNKITVNLKSPLAINLDLCLGMQIVLEQDWPIKYAISIDNYAQINT